MNKDSSVGITEDLLTNIMQLIASEYHLNILVRKYEDQMVFWHNDGSPEFQSSEDIEAVFNLEDKVSSLTELLRSTTEARREAMRLLKSQGNEKGNPDVWCLLKHLLGATITAFEVWQVDLTNVHSKKIFIEQSRVTNQVIAMFLGYEVTPCSACLTDQME